MDVEEAEVILKTPIEFPTELTVDEVVEGYAASFGFSQFLQVFLVSLARVFDAQSTLVTIFADLQPESWRCIVPGCGGGGGGGGRGSVCGLEPGSWEWSGGNRSSTVAEWGLVCDRRFLAAVPASVYFIGSLVGSAVFGCLADGTLGRKRSLLLSCLLTSATLFLTSLSPNLFIYSILRFANGFSRSGIGICCLVLSTEAIARKHRGQIGQFGFLFFSAGFLSIPFAAYHTRNRWRILYRLFSLFPAVYSILLLAPFVLESPRWLVIQGRSQEAIEVLRRYVVKELPEDLRLKPLSEKVKNTNSPLIEIWGKRWAVMRMARVMLIGFGVGLVYFGIQFNLQNLDFNLYITVSINAVLEIPSVLIGGFLLGFTNRRLLFSSSSFIAGASCILCVFISTGKDGFAQLVMEALGFTAICNAYNVLYVYCVELFPTEVRNFAVCMVRQALMLGASVAPLLVALGRGSGYGSFVVFGVLCGVSGVLSFWLPETRNCPLYETLEQQEEEEEEGKVRFEQLDLDLDLEMAKKGNMT